MPQSRSEGRGRSKPGESAAAKAKQLEGYTQATDNLVTTNQGVVVPDNHNSLKAGSRGPSLLEDFM